MFLKNFPSDYPSQIERLLNEKEAEILKLKEDALSIKLDMQNMMSNLTHDLKSVSLLSFSCVA